MSAQTRNTPFEIHLTCGNYSAAREQDFIALCEKQHCKPLLIELAQGEHQQQPMLSKTVYRETLNDALQEAKLLTDGLSSHSFNPVRLKIEVPAKLAPGFARENLDFENYFEWHAKVNYDNRAQLLEICRQHKVHLSLNVLKHNTGFRFITLREFGTAITFESRIAALTTALNNEGYTVSKQQFEYCIYDNNKLLDAGWLPQ